MFFRLNRLGDDLHRSILSGTRSETSIGKSLIKLNTPCLNFKNKRDYAQMIEEYHIVGVHLTATDTRKRHTFPRQCMPPMYPLRELLNGLREWVFNPFRDDFPKTPQKLGEELWCSGRLFPGAHG